jgi:hypothetical protein
VRSRVIAVGCALIGTAGLLGIPQGIARAASAAAVPAAARTQLSVATAHATYHYGDKVIVTVTLDTTIPGGSVSLYAQPAGQGIRRIAAGKVNAKHKLLVAYNVTRNSKFTAVFAGSKGHAAARASRTVGTRARVASRVTNYFKVVKFNGNTYYYFHARKPLTLHSTVTPNKHGECLRPETQQWDKGPKGPVWDADTKYGCDTLDSQSHDSSAFDLSSAAGDKYRIRGTYLHSKRDTVNLSAAGPWVYFIVVKLGGTCCNHVTEPRGIPVCLLGVLRLGQRDRAAADEIVQHLVGLDLLVEAGPAQRGRPDVADTGTSAEIERYQEVQLDLVLRSRLLISVLSVDLLRGCPRDPGPAAAVRRHRAHRLRVRVHDTARGKVRVGPGDLPFDLWHHETGQRHPG